MHTLDGLAPGAGLAGAWCNSSLAATALLEAMSFATPPLERFFIRTVRDSLRRGPESAATLRAREFVREESSHSAAHRRLNQALAGHLGRTPPGLERVEAILDFAARRLPLPVRLLSVEVMEQGSALGSAAYLWCERRADFDCAYARQLFAQHAREEMGHSTVIRELRGAAPARGLPVKAVACALTALAGIAYLAVAVPWIMMRKRRLRRPRQVGAHERGDM